jgi:putative flippase GtrA
MDTSPGATVVLIPALEPGDRLVELVRELRAAAPGSDVVVVDDGSGPAYADVFARVRSLGAVVVTHATNRGKGAALKTGFAHIERHLAGRDVVCADCDGQHAVADVLRVAARVAGTGSTVLGARAFVGRVPLRSRLGNAATRTLFRLATRSRVRDTQTGLRGYPADLLGWLGTVPGERFEYELTLLLRAARAGHRVEELPIETIYLEGNASSHFRPLADSARVYAPLLRFCASSLAGFTVDAVLLLALSAVTGSLVTSVVGARLASSTVNFLINRHLVFDGPDRRPLRSAAVRYWGLVAALVVANYALLAVLTGAGLALLVAKVVTEVTLFATGYAVQHRLVYSRRGAGKPRDGDVAAPGGGGSDAAGSNRAEPVLTGSAQTQYMRRPARAARVGS